MDPHTESPVRILVVDDDPEAAEIVEHVLRESGMDPLVRPAGSQEELLRALDEFAPELVISDYRLPGFTGDRVLGLVRERSPGIPVIILTGSAGEETAVACLREGAADFILKSRFFELPAAVTHALAARRLLEEREGALEALRESEERYRSLVETAHDAILSVDEEGAVTLWNSAAQAIFGYSAAEILGGPVSRLLAREGAEETAAGLLDLPGVGPGWVLEHTMELLGRGKDGCTFPIELSLGAWERGGRRGFALVIRDITERMETRGALEKMTREQNLLLDSVREGIMGVDTRGAITFANPAAEALLGWGRGELPGRPLAGLLGAREGGPDDGGETGNPLRAAVERGLSFQGESSLLRRDGTAFPAQVSCNPILQEEAPAGAVLVFQDITDRRQQEEALRASEASYRDLVEHATYGVYRSTPEGRFLAVNPALVEMLGYESEEELLAVDMGRDLYQDPGERARLIRRHGEREKSEGVEVTWRRRDGSPLRVRLSGRPQRDPEGKVQCFEMIAEDVTARHALEEQLRQAQKMEAVGQLAAGVSHDFNNLLAVILTSCEFMERAVERGEAVDPGDLGAVHRAAERAARTTRQLLAFSRRTALRIGPTELARAVLAATPMLETLLPESVRIRTSATEGGPLVLVDAGAIEQILLNLAANSRDAMPAGGDLHIGLTAPLLDEEHCALHPGAEPGPHVCLEISDTGVGMEPRVLERAFEPFFTTKGEGKGTGLGLAMVQGLTRLMGGHITVESEAGHGTTVRLFFPVFPGEVEPEGREGWGGLEGGRETILLVEDEKDLRESTARALERFGYTVLTAADGEIALEAMREKGERVDLVFSDVVMPGMGGAELHREIRASFGPVRCLLTSGWLDEELAGEEGAGTSIPFLPKPWTLQELLSALRRVLDAPPPTAREGLL